MPKVKAGPQGGHVPLSKNQVTEVIFLNTIKWVEVLSSKDYANIIIDTHIDPYMKSVLTGKKHGTCAQLNKTTKSQIMHSSGFLP